jgi:hypothetical protein
MKNTTSTHSDNLSLEAQQIMDFIQLRDYQKRHAQLVVSAAFQALANLTKSEVSRLTPELLETLSRELQWKAQHL